MSTQVHERHHGGLICGLGEDCCLLDRLLRALGVSEWKCGRPDDTTAFWLSWP